MVRPRPCARPSCTASTGSRSTRPRIRRLGAHVAADATLVNSPSLTLEEVEAIVDEAHRLGLKVACHAYGGEGMRSCLSTGVDSPNHMLELDDAGVRLILQKKPTSSRLIDDLISLEKADLRETAGRNSRFASWSKPSRKALAPAFPSCSEAARLRPPSPTVGRPTSSDTS